MKYLKHVSVWLSALLTAALLCACSSAPAMENHMPQSRPPQKGYAFITIDINPSVELTLGEDRTVTSVTAVGEDAAVLLWQETLVDLDLETAVGKLTRLAMELGYLTEDHSTVSVTVSTGGNMTREELLACIGSTVEQSGANAGLTVSVEEEVDLVRSHELNRVLAEHAGQKGYDESLTLSRYRLIRAAMDADPSLAMDAAVLLSDEKLTYLVEAARRDAQGVRDRAATLACDEAFFAYENAKQTLLDSAYTAVYTSRRNLSSLLHNHGATYAACRLAYRTVSHYAESMRTLVENPLLNENDISKLAEILQIDAADLEAFRQAISDGAGSVTRESVEAYLNKQYRSLPVESRTKLDAAYVEVLSLFDRLGAEAAVIDEEGRLLITTSLFGLGISMEVKTYDDLPALLAAIEKKTEAVFARMEEDLTENEKAEVAEMQEKMSTEIAELEETYRAAVEEARTRAEERLTREKNRRKGK